MYQNMFAITKANTITPSCGVKVKLDTPTLRLIIYHFFWSFQLS